MTVAQGIWNGVMIAGSVAATALGAAINFLTGPIGLVILAITAIIAIIVTLVKNWDTVKEVAAACWDTIKNVWNAVATWFNDNVIHPLSKAFNSFVSGLKYAFDIVWWGIKAGVISMANLVIDVINTMVKGALAPLNLLIDGLNLIPGVNIKKLAFSIQKISLPPMPAMALGGELLQGMAMVAEAGPELLMQQGNRTRVVPLTESGGSNQTDIIDYDKMTDSFIRALSKVKIDLDKAAVGRFVDSRVLRAVGE
jgi:hypothetical protein